MINNSARTQAQDLFTALKSVEVPSFELLDKFHNGTGYFDSLVGADVDGTKFNQVYKAIGKDGRTVFFMPCVSGKNLVVFERYTPGTNSPLVIIVQTTNKNSANDPVETLAACVELAQST